jgi:hypothetical protein
MGKRFRSRMIPLVVAALAMAASAGDGRAVVVSGTKHFVVLRVYFHDYAATSRYTQTQVEGMFGQLAQLWGTNSSYGNITITYAVSTLFQLPGNRSAYIQTPPDNLSSTAQYYQLLNDAVANSPSGIDWSSVDGVVVIMAETDTTKFHRGQGNKCNLAQGPGSTTTKLVGCAIFSENPSNTDVEVWGRWAHEVGHALQAGGPAHPSNYNSNFEQMDANYPGQTGVFEKQSSVAFGWLPDSKYAIVTPAMGGASFGLYAEEFVPNTNPNAQAIKAYIGGVGSAYYLVSLRRRVLGDDLNDAFTPNGIPDEGALIERVVENADPWVTIQGHPDRDKLWHQGDTYTNASDGITISIRQPILISAATTAAEPDNYIVDVFYGDNSNRPDVGLNSWLQPPGNTYESTDIWVDSAVNGYGTYRYGMWSDLLGGMVPKGNGDNPAIGQVNRLYARVRNFGTQTATNVVVHFDVTSPLGLGIAGSNGFVQLGTVTSAQFPGLASIPAGGHTDVYINWTPNATLTPEQQAAGIFYFHSCVRVRLDHLSNEIIFGNQDGNGQQENIDYFQAPAAGGGAGAPYKTTIMLHNDDKLNAKSFMLSYEPQSVPAGWNVNINGGQLGVDLAPDEIRLIPVEINPLVPMPLGATAAVVIQASSLRLLVNNKNPSDVHPDFNVLGGVRVEGHAVAQTHVTCTATPTAGGVSITGKLTVDPPGTLDPHIPVFLAGLAPAGIDPSLFTAQATLAADGTFSGTITRTGFNRAVCLFAGTDTLGSATSGYLPVQ